MMMCSRMIDKEYYFWIIEGIGYSGRVKSKIGFDCANMT